MRTLFVAACLVLLAGPVFAASDAQIKQAIIQQSLAAYPGPCPCPYNIMRNSRACGRRSAYSRPGGYSPICYESDVTPAMVQQYRASHPGE